MDATLEKETICLPAEDKKLLKEIAKKFGWKIARRKKTGYEEAIDDVRAGRVSEVKDIDAYFNQFEGK